MSFEFFDSIAETASDAFDYVKNNEWAGDMVAGAAGAAGSYLLQKDQQNHERDMVREKRSYDVSVNNVAPGAMNMSAYGSGLTKNGMLTEGLLTKRG